MSAAPNPVSAGNDDGKHVAVLILAAGSSRRAGNLNKLTAMVGDKPMIARVADAVLASPARPVIVVTGHQAAAVRAALAGRDVTFAHNPDFEEGIASSIRAGIAALPGTASGVLICLGDMPMLAAADIARLVAAFDPEAAPICVPLAGGRRGNPVLFAKALFAELAALSGDTGARGVLAAHPDMVREVSMDGEGTLTDLDTARQIAAFNAASGGTPDTD
jgi:molybdenum cofactor cytidylyltransferase